MATEKDGASVLQRPAMDEISPTSSPVPRVVEIEDDSPRQSMGEDVEAARRRAENKEAMQYWGRLVRSDRCGSDKLNSLLAGIAQYISTNFSGLRECPDLTPSQLAAFYQAVGGNYDVLFVETQASSISFIYKALGCLHSLQPKDYNNGHEVPSIPALKHKGFVTWQTIQLLLGPEEHVPFLQEAVKKFDIRDPETGDVFPKILPDEAFPSEPDPEMLKWYDQVHERLQRDMQQPDRPQRQLSLHRGDSTASEQSDDERMASYFRNPAYRDHHGRPPLASVRPSYKPSPRRGSREPSFTDRGKAVINSVRHFVSPPSIPHHSQSRHERRDDRRDRYRHDDDDGYENLTPVGGVPPSHRPRPPRSPELMTDSDSDSVHVPRRPQVTRRTSSREKREREARDRDARERKLQREINELSRKHDWERRSSPSSGHPHDAKSPTLRHRRSFEPQVSPVDYFPRHYFADGEPRRHSNAHHSSYVGPDAGGFAPSKEPSMASRVANMQRSSRTSSPRARHDGSGASYPRNVSIEEPKGGSYSGRPTVRYSRRSIDEAGKRDGERPRYERSSESRGSGGSRGSSERLKEPKSELGKIRSRSYDRDADRLRQSTRYVEGASGRRYPSKVPWE